MIVVTIKERNEVRKFAWFTLKVNVETKTGPIDPESCVDVARHCWYCVVLVTRSSCLALGYPFYLIEPKTKTA
jgi:hypothetical protein